MMVIHINVPTHYNLGGTPLNSAIISAMQIVPEFKKFKRYSESSYYFLTDGSSNVLRKFVMFKEMMFGQKL